MKKQPARAFDAQIGFYKLETYNFFIATSLNFFFIILVNTKRSLFGLVIPKTFRCW